MAKPKIKHTITRKEWNKKHKDFKLMGRDGIPYIMMYDDKIGTHLVPVKIIDESVNEAKTIIVKFNDNDQTLNFSDGEKARVDYDGEFKYKGKWFDTTDMKSSKDLEKMLAKAFPGTKFIQKESAIKLTDLVKEANVETYHKSFTHAAEAAKAYALKKGYDVNEDDWQSQVAFGGKYSRSRPGVGKSHSFSVGLLRNGKPQRKSLNFSVYGMESGNFELTAYIN